MIVITTPTGRIGSQLTRLLLDGDEPVRLIARDAHRLGSDVRERAEIVAGAHDDPAVLDQALDDARALFWLVPPPNSQAPSAHEHYLSFARAGVEAVRRHDVHHVVAVSSAGHGWSKPAGLLSAAFAMDAEFERSTAAYRALSMPFYLENLLGQAHAIGEQQAFYLTYDCDRPLACIATIDIARRAAGLLTDRTWDGRQYLPMFGPDHLTPNRMAEVISDLLDRPVTYHQTSLSGLASMMEARGARPQAIQDTVEMLAAQNDGIYDSDWSAATPTETDFRTWCERVLVPAASPTSAALPGSASASDDAGYAR